MVYLLNLRSRVTARLGSLLNMHGLTSRQKMFQLLLQIEICSNVLFIEITSCSRSQVFAVPAVQQLVTETSLILQ